MPQKKKNKDLDESQYHSTVSLKASTKIAPKPWTCEHEDCDGYENEADSYECDACGEPRFPEEVDKLAGFKCGLVTSIEALADKLKVCTVDLGDAKSVSIVTNAGNVSEGSRVVVATVGSLVDDVALKKKSVGGRPSEGMLCDAPMLGWTGGGAGAAALVPESFAAGARPPDKRPRMDGK